MLLLDSFNIRNAFVSLLILLDSIVYSFVGYVYQVFVYLADFTIFTTSDYKTIADRMYILVGVVALFMIAFSLLQSLVNPDDLSKGKNAPIKVVKNILISITLLGVTPTIFNFAYDAQNRILRSQVLQNIILNGGSLGGTRVDCGTGKRIDDVNLNNKEGLKKIGNYMSVGVFSSFFTGNADDPYGFNIKSEDDPEYTLCEAYEDVKNNGDFTVFDDFVKNTRSDTSPENRVNYSMGISLACGVIVFYLLLTFSIGLAVRAIKLAYYQLIAPIPILARIVPQGQKIFDNWLKGTLSVFAEVFIRLLVVFFAILMIQISVGKIDDIIFGNPDASTPVLLLAKVLLIIGFLIFAKKAPEFITDMVGIKSGSLKLGIKDQIREAALIGKPIATGMDKAQGLITGGLGAGWSHLKGSVSGRERPEGSTWEAVKYGAMTGVSRGGNQFSAGKDAEYNRETNKEGSDSIWGEIDRRAKGYVKDENKRTRAAYDAIIKEAESSEAFSRAREQALGIALSDSEVQAAKEGYINQVRDSYISSHLDDIKSPNAQYVDAIRNSDLFKQMVANGADELTAIRDIAKNGTRNPEVTSALEELGQKFDSGHRKADAEKAFDTQFSLEHASEITASASKIMQQTDELYRQAVVGQEAFRRSESQKDFKAVIEKMMKDEKAKGGGASSPKDNGKK